MTPATWFLSAYLLHLTWAAAVAVAGHRGPGWGRLALWTLSPLELALPLLLPLGHPGAGLARLLLAISCAVSVFKACEIHLARTRNPYPTALRAWWWLAWVRPWNHVHARQGLGPRWTRRVCVRRIALGCVLMGVGVPLVVRVFAADLGRHGFWLDHVAKFAATYVVLMGFERVLTGGVNLAGVPAAPVLDDPAFAVSPAEFWQRWNTPVNALFRSLLFRRWARRAPLGALLATFLLSGVFHEYVAAIASLHMRGYQVAFFLIQGLAAAVTWRWKPRGPARVAGHLGTTCFGLLTSPLFFASLVPVFADLVTLYPHGELLPP